MTKETASRLLELMNGLCETEQGRLAIAVLRYIATGEKKEPRGTERAFYGQAIKMIYTDDVQECTDCTENAHDLRNIYINNPKDLTSQVSTSERNNTTTFDTFWSAYPVKVNKKRASDLWKKLKPDEKLLNKMLHSIEAWKNTRQWREGYIPYPDTWLRGEKWNDEIPQEHKSVNRKNTGYASRIITDDQIQFVDLNEEPKQKPKNPALRYEQKPISKNDFDSMVVDLNEEVQE